MDHTKLDHASRSCSTWVAVGDVASTSQLPSPHGGHSIPPAPATSPAPPTFTAADLIRSVNKKASKYVTISGSRGETRFFSPTWQRQILFLYGS